MSDQVPLVQNKHVLAVVAPTAGLYVPARHEVQDGLLRLVV